eukprot:CAMPEP_0197516896 /NCGR_PEP_ID=MMETSP1318-20131121/1831_1 /TAXON_ID=552666 /ORGANISM="Partenskyella glossopodia, Strain RCC365" /LENGTH=333 /DNA_ID=CAMNT_0043066007 /DNA_START=443 /DNA_END=1442 /DNA_ORIENTATION=+
MKINQKKTATSQGTKKERNKNSHTERTSGHPCPMQQDDNKQILPSIEEIERMAMEKNGRGPKPKRTERQTNSKRTGNTDNASVVLDFIKDTHLNLKNRWAHKPTMINPDAIKGNFQALCEKFTIRTQTKPKVVKDYCRTTNSPSNVLRALTSHEFFTAEEAKEVHYQLEKAHPAMAVAANGLGNPFLAFTVFLDNPEITCQDIHRGGNQTFEALKHPIRILVDHVTKNMNPAKYVQTGAYPLGKVIKTYLKATTEMERLTAEVWIKRTEKRTSKTAADKDEIEQVREERPKVEPCTIMEQDSMITLITDNIIEVEANDMNMMNELRNVMHVTR